MSARPVFAFNTGRRYSAAGQRIAAIEHNDYIVFVDIDRGLAYATYNAPGGLCRAHIETTYAYGITTDVYTAIPDAIERERVLDELRAAARAVPAVRS